MTQQTYREKPRLEFPLSPAPCVATVHLDGHIMDSLTLSKALDIILRDGGRYDIRRFQIGATRTDPSHAEIEISAPNKEALEHILHALQQHGAVRVAPDISLQSASMHVSEQPVNGVLMCAPTAYALKYEINPWMRIENTPDIPLAVRQWHELHRVLTEEVGVTAHLVPQAEDAPDMVFTANAGLVRGKTALLSNFRHPERQVEEPHFQAWFEAQGYDVLVPPREYKFEGEGDALFAGDTLLAGYLKRSDIGAHRWMADVLNVPVLSLELVDDRWYHLDTCLFPLTSELMVYYPGAFDAYGRAVIANTFDTIEVNQEEALRFACNAVVIGQHVVLPSGCPQLTQSLTARGYTVHSVELSEFLKAGGAAKCLTLLLR